MGGANVVIKNGVLDMMKLSKGRVKKWLKDGVKPSDNAREKAALGKLHKGLVSFIKDTDGI